MSESRKLRQRGWVQSFDFFVWFLAINLFNRRIRGSVQIFKRKPIPSRQSGPPSLRQRNVMSMAFQWWMADRRWPDFTRGGGGIDPPSGYGHGSLGLT